MAVVAEERARMLGVEMEARINDLNGVMDSFVAAAGSVEKSSLGGESVL
jgi:hypothetical protein